MTSSTVNRALLLSSLGAFGLFGCTDGMPVDAQGDLDNMPPLSSLEEIKSGVPKADEIPRIEGKADEVLPTRFDELRQVQSPVKSQGRRGVCSIFSTTALMEHLYIAEGTIQEPDFSEQYLQWSVKFELGTFPSSSGSNANYNLRAISRFGIPEESAWPYEINQWGTEEDADCDGEDDQPTRCYTNGAPSTEARAAEKFTLPEPHWVHPYDLKTAMHSQKVGAAVGLDFFYQSWNHGRSPLPTNDEYFAQGYVLYPNAKDREESTAEDMSAGHSILIIGWDDDLEVQRVDADGNKMVDENGDAVVEKGFYIFKNSWGTEGFGVDHDLGAGYGYISQRYVHEYGGVAMSDLPDFGPRSEVCGDGYDNDRNGVSDCDDTACFGDASCGGSPALVFESTEAVDIPDNDRVGISSEIEVAETGTVVSLVVDVNIVHTYQGDLTVTLHKGDRAVVLHQLEGGGRDDLVATYAVTELAGVELAGTWELAVTDTAAADMGTLQGWTLRVQAE